MTMMIMMTPAAAAAAVHAFDHGDHRNNTELPASSLLTFVFEIHGSLCCKTHLLL
jgi:hypothetical protein